MFDIRLHTIFIRDLKPGSSFPFFLNIYILRVFRTLINSKSSVNNLTQHLPSALRIYTLYIPAYCPSDDQHFLPSFLNGQSY